MSRARDARRRFRIVLAFVLPLAITDSARAAPESVRIVVRTVVALDDALYERTLGQVSDLPATVERAPVDALEPSMTARLEEARTLASRRDAAMIVWFEHPPNAGPVVVVALPSRERVLVRPVANGGDLMAGSSSAMVEAASLVVRNALLAFEAGAALGVPTEELTHDEKAAKSTPKPPVRPPPPRAAPPLHRMEDKTSWRPFIGAGWQVTIDGRSPLGARAAVVEGGLERAPFRALLRGSLGLPSRSHDDLVALEVHRHSAGGFVGYRVANADAFELEGLAGVSVVFFRRAAFARNASFTPTPATTHTSLAASLDLRLWWTPAPSFVARLGFGVGADVLATPASFSYQTASGIVERPSWYVEPRLGFTALFGR